MTSPTVRIVDDSPEQKILIPATAHTLAGFRTWAKSDQFPDHGHISFINQEIIIDMSPEELETHVIVKMEIARVLLNFNRKKQFGKFYGDGTLVSNELANLSTEPDATFITWETLDAGRVRLIPRTGEKGQYIEVEGTPDWVLEIVSDNSVRKDTVRLRQRYHRAGIPEYWLVDARGEEISFQILLHGDTDYIASLGRNGWQESRVFGRKFRLIRQRDQRGFWDYTLQMKSIR
jgi:Uma2 family endonuclease